MPEIGDQLAVELADFGRRHGHFPNPEGPPTQIDRGGHQGLVHGKDGVAVSPDPGPVAECTIDRLAQADAHVFGRVMPVHMQVARARDRQVHERMPREQIEHVIKEADPRTDLGSPLAVEVEPELDIGFAGLAYNLGARGEALKVGGPGVSGIAGFN